MVNVTIYVKNGSHAYTGFDITGHAGSSGDGSDIVCAAISMLVINTINAIETFTEDPITCDSDSEKGSIRFRFSGKFSDDAQLLIKAMILGLESIEADSMYEPYIDMIFEEV